MAFVIEDTWLPATLTMPAMNDEQFAAFCAVHPDLFFEMTADGELIVMPPNYTVTGIRNLNICHELAAWTRKDKRGIASDSSTGFVLPSGARRSADAAWTLKERVASLPANEVGRYWHLCPDFVIELRSHYDRLPALRRKMREWIAAGAQLGWLIDAEAQTVEIFRADGSVEIRSGINVVAGEGPVNSFVLDLETVWNPL